MPSSAASDVLWDVLSRSGVERARPDAQAPAEKKVSTQKLARRLQFHTLLQDALDAEPWEVERNNAHEAAVQEKAEAIESLKDFERKPHMLCELPPGVIRRVLHPTSWSDEAVLVRSELPAHERTARNLLAFFKTLRLESKAITHIDRALLKMSNLQELSLRDNEIVEVESLPPNLRLLSLCMNRIEALGARGAGEARLDTSTPDSHSATLSSRSTRPKAKGIDKTPLAVKKEGNNHPRQSHTPAGRGKGAAAKQGHATPGKGGKGQSKEAQKEEEEPLSWNEVLRRRSRPSVMLLSAAHNVICDVTHIGVLFPGLQILHLGYNNLVNVVEATAALRPLSQLSVLTLVGNPMCLRKDYRPRLVHGLRSVTRLDGVEVEEWERNTKLSDHALTLEAKILTQWNDTLAARRRSDFEQEGLRSDQDRYTFIELSAARKLQRLYRAMKKRQVSTLQRRVLQAERRGELVTLRVCVDWLKLALPVEPPPATPAKGKKPDPKAVEEPEGPKEQLSVRLVLPSELTLSYSLPYKDKKPLVEFNHTQDFQLPVTAELRDAFFFRGLRFQVWSKRPESEATAEDMDTPRSSLSSGTAKEPQQVLLAKGVLSFRPLFDSAAFKASLCSPVLTHEASLRLMPIPRRRRHPPRTPEAPPASAPTNPEPLAAQMPMPGGAKRPAGGFTAPEPAPSAPTITEPIDAVLRLRVELNAAPVDPTPPPA